MNEFHTFIKPFIYRLNKSRFCTNGFKIFTILRMTTNEAMWQNMSHLVSLWSLAVEQEDLVELGFVAEVLGGLTVPRPQHSQHHIHGGD